MSDKQSLLQAVVALPDGASWTEITDTLLAIVARRGTAMDYARMYRTQISDEQLAEYRNPVKGIPLDDVIEELEARPTRESP